MQDLQISLSYVGSSAEAHQLDFYDGAVALMGFQRSLALTTHLVLNNEIITQAPALKRARIFVEPPQEGSWKIMAAVTSIGAATFALGTADKDTPIGHLVSSAYDYVIKRTLGFHVDYDKTLGEQYEELHKKDVALPAPDKNRFDSLIEKTEVAVRDMHRPIISSGSAEAAFISTYSDGKERIIGQRFDIQSYERMMELKPRSTNGYFEGRISSYNMNTFKGRVFLIDEGRPVPFEVADSARNPENILAITRSLSANAEHSRSNEGLIGFTGLAIETRTGRLKEIILQTIET
jgi:hypothetical protein